MVRLEGIKKTYSDFTVSLDFNVRRGELVSLLGPSGSGKTTALRIIAGFERPDEGRIIIDGRDVTDLDPSRRRIGFVFQDYTLFPHLDAGHNIAYGLKHRGLAKEEIKQRVEELLSTVGLPGFGGRGVAALSGGEQQRVAVARSLAVDPLVLMLDEPFSSIDSVLRRDLREEILRLQKKVGITTLFITHDREEAFSVSDRVILLRNGSVVQAGPPEELYDRPVDRFTAAFVGPANFFTGLYGGTAGGYVTVRDFIDFRVSDPRGKTAGAAVGDKVTFMVRSDKLHFAGPSKDNGFPARITGRRYYGHYREYLCATEAGPVGVYCVSPVREDGPCTITFAPEDGIVVESIKSINPL
jgi:ABC-type Fe3+/spermidine/putrescine transport system ATPase subunit